MHVRCFHHSKGFCALGDQVPVLLGEPVGVVALCRFVGCDIYGK